MKLHEIVTEAYYDSYSGRNFRGNGHFGGRSYSERLRDEARDLGDETDPAIGSRTQWARRPQPQQSQGQFMIQIDGKIWKKDGQPVKFSSQQAAERAKASIEARLAQRGQQSQVEVMGVR